MAYQNFCPRQRYPMNNVNVPDYTRIFRFTLGHDIEKVLNEVVALSRVSCSENIPKKQIRVIHVRGRTQNRFLLFHLDVFLLQYLSRYREKEGINHSWKLSKKLSRIKTVGLTSVNPPLSDKTFILSLYFFLIFLLKNSNSIAIVSYVSWSWKTDNFRNVFPLLFPYHFANYKYKHSVDERNALEDKYRDSFRLYTC